MGSLYDMGNFRYKHFTFYSCGANACNAPNAPTEDQDNHMIKFLDAVWPHNALIMGESAENDRAFVTYVRQDADFSLHVENIYIFIRVTPASGATPEWIRELTPVTSLNPEDHE